MENFSLDISEDGVESFKCLICSQTFGSQKSVKTHVTKKHSSKSDTVKIKNKPSDDDPLSDVFDFEDPNVVKSTQDNPNEERIVSTEAIFKEYEDDDDEEITLDEAVNVVPVVHIPDDTFDEVARDTTFGESNNDAEEEVDTATKIESLEKVIEEKNEMLRRMEEDLLSSQLEVSSQEEELGQVKSENAIKDETNKILIAEKNGLEAEKVQVEMENTKLTTIMHKIYNQKNVMKKTIEQLRQNPKEDQNEGSTNSKNVIKEKDKRIADLIKRNKELIEELAECQNKSNKHSGNDDRISKMSKVVSNKNKENNELLEENKRVKKSNEELLKRLKDVSEKVSSLEVAKTRLESQVDHLIEAVGKKVVNNENVRTNAAVDERERTANVSEAEIIHPSGRKVEEQGKPKAIKCRHNDKGSCNRGENCFFFHSKSLCRIYSKYGECENQETCFKRHPVGICARWRKDRCDRDLDCLYRHPVDTHDALPNNQKSPNRYDEKSSMKRRLSNQQEENPKSARISSDDSQNHFLVQQYKELKQQVDSIQTKKENVPQGWINPGWIRAPGPPQLSVIQNPVNQAQWNQPSGRLYQGDQSQGQHQFPVMFQ